MLQPQSRPIAADLAPVQATGDGRLAVPLFGVIDAVVVEDFGEFRFDGAVPRRAAANVWTWIQRDLAPDLIQPIAGDPNPAAAFEKIIPEVLSRARTRLAEAKPDSESERRLRVQLDDRDTWTRLPAVLLALKTAPLLRKAQAFGRVVNTVQDDDALIAALQAMPRHDAAVAALLMVAAVGQIMTPHSLVIPATRVAGEADEAVLVRAGFAPLIDALLAHAQNAIPAMRQSGAFADIDLVCRAIERFHRLMRAISGYVELARPSRWSPVMAGLTRTASAYVEPRLREVIRDLNRALRPRPDGEDRVDEEALFAALGGTYLLATIRECRDSLALNELFDDTWLRSGSILEILLSRLMDARRADPADRIAAQRLETGIQIAEIRFGADYAEVLRSANEAVERRLGSSG